MGHKGQASVEYILLILVVVTVSFSTFKKIEEYLVSNPDSLINGYLVSFESTFNQSGAFKTFSLRR